MWPIGAEADSIARGATKLHEEAPGSTPGAYSPLATQTSDPIPWPLPHATLAPRPASLRRPQWRWPSGCNMRKRRRARGALGRQPSRRCFSVSRVPIAASSAQGSSDIASDPERRWERPRSGILRPVQLADDLHPEHLGSRVPQPSERFRALRTTRVFFVRKRQDQVQVHGLALAGRLELTRVHLHKPHTAGIRRPVGRVVVLHGTPVEACSALSSSSNFRVRIRHDLERLLLSREAVDHRDGVPSGP